MSDNPEKPADTETAPHLTPLKSERLQLDDLQVWSKPVPTRRNGLLGMAALVLFLVFGLGGYWSATAKIGGAVISTGRVIAEGENRVVQHLEGGILSDLMVREGDEVKTGQVLAVLDETATSSQLDNAWIDRALYTISLQRWRAERDDLTEFEITDEDMRPVEDNPRVKEALESQRREFVAAREARLQQISVLKNQIASEEEDMVYLEALLQSYDRQVELLSQEYDAFTELLEKGLTSRSRVFSLQRELSRIEAQKSNALATIQKSRNNIRSHNESIAQIESERRELTSRQITESQKNLNDVSDVINRLEDRLVRSTIVAPVDGVVFRLPIKSVGAVIKPGDTLAEILPKDAALQMEVNVSPNDIDKLYIGQEVDIVFPSDRTDITPPLRGKLDYISADAVLNPNTGLSYYIAHVDMGSDHGGRSILPGNVGDAFFQTDARTFVEYMADPITRFASKSFSE